MSTPLACLICSLDPQNTALILPIAQATIVAAPVILRDELRKGARAIRARRGRGAAAGDSAPSPDATPDREVASDR